MRGGPRERNSRGGNRVLCPLFQRFWQKLCVSQVGRQVRWVRVSASSEHGTSWLAWSWYFGPVLSTLSGDTYQCTWYRAGAFFLPLKCGPLTSYLCQAICHSLWNPHQTLCLVVHRASHGSRVFQRHQWGFLFSISQAPLGIISWLLCLDLIELNGPVTPEFETLLGLCLFHLSDDPSSFEWVHAKCLSLSRERTDPGCPARNGGGRKEEQCHGTQDKSLLPIDCCSLVNKPFSSGILFR